MDWLVEVGVFLTLATLVLCSAVQRKWNVGDKFHDDDATTRFPTFNQNWVSFPARHRRLDLPFLAKPENSQVGNVEDHSNDSIVRVWLKLFERPCAMACAFTNIAGRKRFGASWKPMTWRTMLQFHACLLRMACSPRPRVRDFFGPNGDDYVKKIGLSGRQFSKIYQCFSLYDPEEASREGYSDPSNCEKYDSLFKVRPVWNATMESFQKVRNPGRHLSLDEVCMWLRLHL